jgi:hypothetical protein
VPRPRKVESKSEAESKLRRDRRHCPVCVKPLPRIPGKGRLAQKCVSCGAEPQPGKRCTRCHQEAIWEAKTAAACQSCGNHGSRLRVIAGAAEASSGNGGA